MIVVSSEMFEKIMARAVAVGDDTPEYTGWTVVDFKTDREFGETSDQYIAQVRVYSEAVAAATREPARGVLLVV